MQPYPRSEKDAFLIVSWPADPLTSRQDEGELLPFVDELQKVRVAMPLGASCNHGR